MIPTIQRYNLFIKNFVAIVIIPILFFPTTINMQAIRVHPMATIMQGINNTHKKLRKLPHVFSKVLELPFRSDADVAVEEWPDFFRFVAEVETDGHDDVSAHAVEIHPGVIKIVVRRGDRAPSGVDLLLDTLEVDKWRFRLPASTRPEMATAAFVDGELVVTVPKGGSGSRREFGEGGGVWAGGNRLVLVQ